MGLEPIVENGIIFYKIEFLLKTKLKNVPLKMNKFCNFSITCGKMIKPTTCL